MIMSFGDFEDFILLSKTLWELHIHVQVYTSVMHLKCSRP